MPSAQVRFIVAGLPDDQGAANELLEIVVRVLGARFDAVALERDRAIFAVAFDPTRADYHELRALVRELGRRLGYELIANLMST